MKRLVVCTDGTWNSRDAAKEDGSGLTNVAKFEKAVAKQDAQGVLQHTFYHAGVGVGPWYEKALGGAFGVGLSRNVQACYSWLVALYEPGDQLFLFGFSRGAYTARSLAGLIRNCGLLKREHKDRVEEAYKLYRDRKPDAHPNSDAAVAFRDKYAHAPRIHCIGVWDTVGSLGVPTSGPVGWFTRRQYGFHDVTLSARVDHAFHALAIDERRKPFAPTLWEVPDSDITPDRTQRVEQMWFAGVHSNVGGGYPDSGLSDHALHWMLDRAQSAGLALDPAVVAALKLRDDGQLYDSMSRFYRTMGEHRRELFVERRAKDGRPIHTFESVHDSVLARHRVSKPPYQPDNLRSWLARFAERVAEGATPTPGPAIPVFPINVTDSAIPNVIAPDAAPDLRDVTSGASQLTDQPAEQPPRPTV
ncbi:DUF2235 domain-containing protein [Roseisolibacter agri]|uniref:T6SS Phospholipase effector Tle1-like catalytic domain-containing protein n=1 Tax=Roseisolibacter agri TaxID=2014610 RepID=A0AA37V165_9BACT|nr:DUF2235 domain-containing protein [Roseisolibacter agri]GLC25690.1 hypothetical protein rosag_22030 [Roseisolibacter agri]